MPRRFLSSARSLAVVSSGGLEMEGLVEGGRPGGGGGVGPPRPGGGASPGGRGGSLGEERLDGGRGGEVSGGKAWCL